MYKQNLDLDLITGQLTGLLKLVEAIKAERQRNTIQDKRLSEHDSLLYEQQTDIDHINKKYEEIMQKFNSFEAKFNDLSTNIFPEIDYLRDENQELKCLSNPYSPDGKSICDSEYDYD
ncbi:hypothetical protein ACP6PL_01010 [Dapis sp. BLCC M126]|uniref:hypothetical protein n=1 Tax=Dapis sp. BLCC M126 TaxID=3400189 RepID=UPI003CEAA168